jgi:hypothetical protein
MRAIFLAVLTIVIVCFAWQGSPVFRRLVKAALSVALVLVVIGVGARAIAVMKDHRERDARVTQAGPAPSQIPAGAKLIGTYHGNPVYLFPDGSRQVWVPDQR